MPEIRIQNTVLSVPAGENLMDALRVAGIWLDAPCGGNGTCGKCRVIVNGEEVLACKTVVDRDMEVCIPEYTGAHLPQTGIAPPKTVDPIREGYLLAFDIGTTSVVCCLLDGKTGAELAQSSTLNSQTAFGADVVSRIRAALRGELEQETAAIREDMTALVRHVCENTKISPDDVGVVSVVGNPAMQQLLLGISPENLAAVPFTPALTEAKTVSCDEILPICPNAQLLIVPDISGYIGADTVGCVLSTELYQKEEMTLLVDIGTNGELVLGNKDRMIACSTAAGPALEGANIQFGMRAAEGAIDHVWLEHGEVKCSVIGGGEAKGICGSGLVDAVAVGLDMGLLNKRGRIQNEDHIFCLTDRIFLTQEDIRQVQLAKGAICAGIALMAGQLGLEIKDIQKVLLAGAFGSYLNPESACRIGLLPEELLGRIEAVGNAAGSGAKLLACDRNLLPLTEDLTGRIEFLELASLPAFPRTFAKSMNFRERMTDWTEIAREMGFDTAVFLDPRMLVAREDVRAMCAEDKCGAYNKNWTCPPAVGTIEACQVHMRRYKHGILLQSVGHMTKTVDSRCYRETERRHMQNFCAFAEEIRKHYPDALCLGAGGCRVCKECAYPQSCRFPEKAMSGMEGYGLFVTQVCRDAGVSYYYGEKTVTYTACVLY